MDGRPCNLLAGAQPGEALLDDRRVGKAYGLSQHEHGVVLVAAQHRGALPRRGGGIANLRPGDLSSRAALHRIEGGLAREVCLLQARALAKVLPALLADDRLAINGANAQQVQHGAAGLDAKVLGHVCRCGDDALLEHMRHEVLAPLAKGLAKREGPFTRRMGKGALGDEGARSAHLDEKPLVDKLADGPPNGTARDAKTRHELVLGGDAGAGRPLVQADLLAQEVCQLGVHGGRSRLAAGPLRGLVRHGVWRIPKRVPAGLCHVALPDSCASLLRDIVVHHLSP